MSVREILQDNGKIAPRFLPDFTALGFVRNPLTSTLQCFNPTTAINHEITQAGRVESAVVQTDNLSLIPGSAQTAIRCDDSLELATAKRLEFQSAGDITVAFGQTLTLGGELKAPAVAAAGAPWPNVLGYDSATGAIEYQAAGGSSFRPSFVYYVAPNGDDVLGDGSASSPYATIQKAINEAELTADTNNRFLISVAAGRYVENLTFTTGYVYVQGSGSSTTSSTLISRIQGNISIAVGGADDLFNKVVSLSGFQITGSITDTSTSQHSTSITNCYLFFSNRCLYFNSSAATSRNSVYDCIINQDTGGTTPSVEITSGWLDIQRTPISSNNDVSLLVVSGTGYLYRCVLCPFENGNASATLDPLVLISSTFPVPHVFYNSSFLMTSATNKTGNPASSAVRFVGNPTVSMSYCAISLAGTAHPANHAISTAGTGTLLTYANAANQLVGTTRIESGAGVITHVALNSLT